MAKKAMSKAKPGSAKKPKKSTFRPGGRAVVRASSGGRREEGFDAGEAIAKLLQSPLVAELIALAATAALATLAEHGFAGGQSSRGKRAGKAAKEAGKAAAAAVGRRLNTEIDEIRAASKQAQRGAKA